MLFICSCSIKGQQQFFNSRVFFCPRHEIEQLNQSDGSLDACQRHIRFEYAPKLYSCVRTCFRHIHWYYTVNYCWLCAVVSVEAVYNSSSWCSWWQTHQLLQQSTSTEQQSCWTACDDPGQDSTVSSTIALHLWDNIIINFGSPLSSDHTNWLQWQDQCQHDLDGSC